jgi:hypothetical protein
MRFTALLLLAVSPPAWTAGFDHAPFDAVLKRFVNEQGRVDYAGMKASPGELDRYVKMLGERSPESHPQDFPNREAKLAYWINAYNALCLRAVRDAWPIGSVRDLGVAYSFFWRRKFTVGGRQYSLNHIENEFLRQQLDEPRIHFAIVCASNSCPKLERAAYTPENTEKRLDAAARFFFSEDRNVKVDAARNQVWINRILTFYRGDFEKWARQHRPGASNGLLEYVKFYTTEAKRAAIAGLKKPKIVAFDYDWGVNDIHAPNPNPKYAKE